MSQANITYSSALILTCALILIAAPGLAAFSDQIGTLLPPLYGQGAPVEKCLSTLQTVKGCVQEVIAAFLSHRVQLIGSACCKVFFDVDNDCWPKVFPFNPIFPPLAKHHCAQILQNSSPSPSPAN